MSEAPTWRLLVGDARERLAELEAGSVHTVVTSPPYFGLRDYGTGDWEGGDPGCDHVQHGARRDAGRLSSDDRVGVNPEPVDTPMRFREMCGRCGARRVDRQLGLEPTPDEFVAALVDVFREARRVLRDDGTVWLNLGDSYAAGKAGRSDEDTIRAVDAASGRRPNATRYPANDAGGVVPRRPPEGVKPKDLLGIPWMVAFALRADGWYLRADIIWSKPNPMPESVTDRPTKAHEYVFLLSKGPRYFYDADAIREDNAESSGWAKQRAKGEDTWKYGRAAGGTGVDNTNGVGGTFGTEGKRNKRSVWTVATQPYAGAHFATFPPKLIEPCILAGAPERACGECGAPWVRVVENHGPDKVNEHDRHTPGIAGRSDNGRQQGLSGVAMGAHWRRETLGFEPSCSHSDGSAAGVVLDPFAGAGTTGLVALQHGREFVGIELNPGYAQMAHDRIATAVRLGFRAPERGPDVPVDQAALFEL